MTATRIHVVSTFDAAWQGVGGFFIRPGMHPYQWAEILGPAIRLPNVLIPAKSTLIAERIKKRLKPDSPIKQVREGLRSLAKPAEKPSPRDQAMRIDSLKGKLLGVEIEYYPAREVKPTSLTDVTGDGSLGAGGVELRRLTWPDRESGRLAGLLAMEKPFLKGSHVDHRCGLHVHVDMRHLTPEQAAACYDKLTDCYEPIKKLVPSTRHTCHFCLWINNRPGANHRLSSSSDTRYAAINWLAYKRHCTVEFRCQAGSSDPLKIESWALFCQWLVGWCSDPRKSPPTTWAAMVACCPEPLRSWIILRAQYLHGTRPIIDPRSLSAVSDK